jgi:hypothetical protein
MDRALVTRDAICLLDSRLKRRSSLAISAADWNRSAFSFDRHSSTIASSSGGMFALTVDIGSGST